MQRIPVAKATEGMVLAKPVKREDGIVLMGEGTELNAFLLEKVKEFGITKIVVKGHPLNLGGEEKGLLQLEAELDERFRLVAADPLCNQIKELFRKELRLWEEEKNL